MLAEFSVCPVGNISMSKDVAKVVQVLESSGLVFKVCPLSTCLEGTMEEILAAIRRCHEAVARDHERVITHIKLDDRKKSAHVLADMAPAVERELGRRTFEPGLDREC